MSLQQPIQPNENSIFYVSQTTTNANNQSGTVIWIDNGMSNIKNQQKLSALKHDHPLIASAVDNNNIKANNGLCQNDSLLIASLPPTTTSSVVQSAQWQHDLPTNVQMENMDEYGNYYDETQGQTHLHANLRNEMDHICFTNNYNEEPMLDDNVYLPTYNNNCIYPCVSQYPGEINIENVFQVDKADLKSGPTLAQLNATNDVWDTLDLDDLLINAQNDRNKPLPKVKFDTNYNSIVSNNDNRSTGNSNGYSMDLEYDAKLQENIDYLTSLLFHPKNGTGFVKSIQSIQPTQMPTSQQPTLQMSTKSLMTQSSLVSNNNVNSNIENSAQQNTIVNHEKQTNVLSNLLSAQNRQIKKEIKTEPISITNVVPVNNNILEIKNMNNRVRNNSMSTEYSASSHDEGFASQPDDSEDEDMSSDDESFYGDYDASDLLGASTSDDANNKWSLNMGRSRKGGERRYFWQYNVQSKGPKGTRLASVDDNGDPHVLKEISDPVFSPDCQIEGVKHSGKARRGDGNDLTPNPKKLLMIGLELKKLSKVINDLTPVAEVPLTARSKSRKEKNKLASRACRLKKKAQHEANKIKLFGLQVEHKKMMSLISDIRKVIKKYADKSRPEIPASLAIEQLVKQKGSPVHIAGRTSEFVNSILDNVASGINSGGLDRL